MRILIITQFFDPEFGAASARLTGLSKELAALGHTVSVITCYPNYPFGKIYSDWKKHPVSLIHDIRVTRVWSYVRPGNSAPYRIINFITFFLFATVNGLKLREKFDVVLSSSPPLIAGLGGVILAKRMGIPHVFDVRDIWPDVAVESGEFSPSSILVKLASTLAQFIYNNSTSITVVTKEKQMRFLQKGYNLKNIHLVENGIDPAIIHNAPRIDLYREFSVNRKRIIAIYAGLLGVAQGVIHLVRIMNTAALQNNVHLLVVGEGSQKKEILEYVREHKLENVTVLDAVGKEKAIGFIKGAHICLVPLANANLQDAIPSKLLEAWACNKSVILFAEGDSANLVRQVDGGVVSPPGDIQSGINAFQSIIDQGVRQRKAQNGFNYVFQNLTRRQLTRKLDKVLCTCVLKS